MRTSGRAILRAWSALGVLPVLAGCVFANTAPTDSSACPADIGPTPAADAHTGDLAIIGRIVTMAERAEAEAVLIQDGFVTCLGTRDEVLAAAGENVAVVDIGDNVAYPGFIDAHAHWIGDRNYYNVETPKEVMEEVVSRGWTSISEQWDDREKLAELEALAAADALPLRVDAYLALSGVRPDEHYGDWYADRQPGSVSDRLRVQGLKIHLDSGTGGILLWEAAQLTETIGRADEAGWQVSVHAVSTEAQEMVLDAFEAAIGPTGPNPRHHRIEHALQVTDDQLDRLVAMDLAVVIQPDGAATDWVRWAATAEEFPRDYEADDVAWLARWRDFVDAGLHVADSTDAPWFFVDLTLADDIGRPVDQIAGGMEGRGRDFVETPEWMRDQLLSAEEGLRGVTVEAAYALGDEERRGHLAPGMLGDVTILSGDVLDATPDDIRALSVLATIVGGEVVYCADPAICDLVED